MNQVISKNLDDFMVKNASRKSRLHSDESNLYPLSAKGSGRTRRSTTARRNMPVVA